MATMTLNGPIFAGIGYDEAIASARAMVPVLRERASAAEAARVILPETLKDLHESGVLRVLQPKRWGGMELDFTACFDVAYELGRGCASTSWAGVNLLIHHWMLALWPEQGQADVWDENPEALIASAVNTMQGNARKVDGGYIVSGRWNFSSGVNVADWNMLGMNVRDGDAISGHYLFVLPKSEYRIVDDWHVLGMRSTGSMTVEANDVFVPEHRVLPMAALRGGSDFPGAAINDNPLFQVALSMLSGHVIAATLVGNAQAAVDDAIATIIAKSANPVNPNAPKLRDSQSTQMRIANASARVDTARLLIRSEMEEGQDYANRGDVPDQERKLRAKRNVSYGVTLCTEAVNLLQGAGGAHGIYDGNALQRIFRDAHAGGSHILFNQDLNYSTWGQAALGGVVVNPML